MKNTLLGQSSEQTSRPSPIIKTIFREKMKCAFNCLKHQNNQKKYFPNLRWFNTSWNLDNAMVKCIIKYKKIYIINTLGPVPE